MSLLIILFPVASFAQISPGDLTLAHAKLEGLSNCTKCHVLGKQLNNNNCLNCHTEIKLLQTTGQGYHSSDEVKNKNCWKCHSEHNGRDFKIINFSSDNFNHEKAGFKLTGKHADIKCFECHKSKFISNSIFMKRKETYLGLNTSCYSCHEDVHQNTLGKKCSSCHNTVKFVPAVLFDHNKAKFKLTGAHVKVDCIKCHEKETIKGKAFQKFTGLNFNNCSPCHRDVHNGSFGNNCIKCHNDDSFRIVNKNSFDHSKTRFPLEGAHTKVSCTDCHGKNSLSKPKFQKCTDCHKDYHFGEFTVNNVLRDCKECHSIDSFKITLYTIDEHNKIRFRLTGAHLAVACESCHYSQNLKQWHFRNIGAKCIDCHKNIHGEEITKKFMPASNCAECHNTESWKKILFNHDSTGFKLLGKHKIAVCRDCHAVLDSSAEVKFRFASLKSDCTTCHRDIHFGQFDSQKSGSVNACVKCHAFDSWKPVNFDHEKTSFPLKGAHEKVKCSACHKKVTENGNAFINYKLREFKCASCHA